MSERDRITQLETLVSNLTYELTCTNHLSLQALQRVNRLAPGFVSEAELEGIQKQTIGSKPCSNSSNRNLKSFETKG